MGFFSGGNIRGPASLQGSNVASRMLRARNRLGRDGDPCRPAFVVVSQQRRTAAPTHTAHSRLFSTGVEEAYLIGGPQQQQQQAAFSAAELPIAAHPAGDEAAAGDVRGAVSNSENSSTPHPLLHVADDGASTSGSSHHFHHQHHQPHGCNHALPEELLRLADASAPVSLPPPHSVPAGSLDNRELDKLVGTLGRNKATWRRALVLSQWLQESGHVLDDRLCTTLIRVCSEHGQAVTALSVYEWMKAPASVGGAGLGPTVYTFTAAMRAALAAGLLDRALQVWEDAQAAKCPLDCRLCITYIEVCSRKGLTDRALAMYAAMQAAPRGSKLAPTVHAYTAAMRAATEGGLWAKALSIWDDMQAAGVTPTGHAFAAAMSACAAGSNWQQAVALFEEMCKAGIKPDVVSCTALISALAAAGQWQRSESVVQWMLSTGVRPNVRTFTALLTALGNARQWDRAFEMLELMQHSSWGGVAPNAYTFSALLKCLGECGEWQRAERLFAMLEQQALQQGAAAASGSSTRSAQQAAAAVASAGRSAAWQQQPGAIAAAGGVYQPEAVPGVWGWQAAGSSNGQRLNQQPLGVGEDVDGQLGLLAGQLAQLTAAGAGTWPTQSDPSFSSISSSRQGSRPDLTAGSTSCAAPAFAGSAARQQTDAAASAVGELDSHQQQGSLWTSASQLHGLDLNLQLEAAASGSGNSSSEGSLGPNSRSDSPEPELQAQLLSDDAVAAAAAAAGVSSNTVAQQLAQLALQQQIAAGMDLQLLMHQQQAQALAASQRIQQQQQGLQQRLQQQAGLYPPPPPAAGPVRTQQMQQMRHRQQQQQHQDHHLASDSGRQGSPSLINAYVVSSLMQAYERAGKWQACVGALARGAALGVVPTASMYTTAVSAAGKAGQLGVADALFAQASASGVADHTTYETMVAVLGTAGEAGRAEVVLRGMEASGFNTHIPEYAYCGLIAGYSLSNDPLSAQQVRTRIVRKHGPGSVSVHVYNALLAAADRAGAYDKALELLRCMRREGVEGNVLTQQLAAEVGRKGAVEVEGQQLTAAALSAAMAAAGTLLMRSGVW